MPSAKKSAAKKPPRRKAAAKKPAARGERKELIGRIVSALGIDAREAELRALRELAERVAPGAPRRPEPAHAAHARKEHGYLPERLYLLLDGRGLDGRGLPVEVIDLPTIVGSERHSTVWINSPQIETRHLQITQEGGDWFIEDLGSEKGTWLGNERIQRRRIEDGDEYRLAGYLRLRTELR